MTAMHENSIVILCLDDSGSMFPNDFPNAVKGAKDALNYLQTNHTNKKMVDLHLWYNDCSGVNCVF